MLSVLMLNVVMLSFVMLNVMKLFQYIILFASKAGSQPIEKSPVMP
jgi:hypothetical protein